jgi:hypothetical protein
MLQTIARLSPIRFVSDDLGQSQRRQNVTYPRHAPGNGARDLAWAQFLILFEYVHYGKSQWIPQETAEARLPINLSSMTSLLINPCLLNCANLQQKFPRI